MGTDSTSAAGQSGDGAAQRRASLLVVTAALLWSSGGFFAKAPYFAGWPGPLLAFWRAAFACVVLLPLVRRPQWTWKLIPMVACFALMNYTYLTAMVLGSPTNAIWLQSTAPVWVLLAGVCLFRERSVGLDWLLIGLCAAGTLVILRFESRGAGLEAFAWGLASGVFYAGVVLSLRQLRAYDSAWLVAINHLATAVLLSWNLTATEYWPSGRQWWLLAGFGMLQMGLPYVLFARGLRVLPGHQASGIGLLEPILVPVWVYLAWGDVPAWWTLAGGGLILLGLVARYVAHRPAIPARS
ncbi:MAG: DMT family transporter [Pirellulales bacterium]